MIWQDIIKSTLSLLVVGGITLVETNQVWAVTPQDITIIATGAEYYDRPRVNNLNEIVWSQKVDGIVTVWSNKRGQISFGSFGVPDRDPDINDAGEIIWRFGDGGQGPDGIESNIRGLIYYEQGGSIDPYYDTQRINNNGEIIWSKPLWPTGYRAEEIWSNDRGRLTYSPQYAVNRQPAINDSGEVVYRSYLGPTGNTHDILSTERGPITNDSMWEWHPDINNSGEVVWTKMPEGAQPNNEYEIWSNERGRITDNSVMDYAPSINDVGEIVWQSWDGHDYEIVSNIRGQITDNDVDDTWPHINNLGTIVWLLNHVEAVVALYATPEITVAIDIKPHSYPNSVNPRSRGVIPVAILTTGTFDALQVDVESVRFGPELSTERHGRAHIEDVDGDGDADMVLHFGTQETGIKCDNSEASLAGKTFDGQGITGTDSVHTVGCKRPSQSKKKK